MYCVELPNTYELCISGIFPCRLSRSRLPMGNWSRVNESTDKKKDHFVFKRILHKSSFEVGYSLSFLCCVLCFHCVEIRMCLFLPMTTTVHITTFSSLLRDELCFLRLSHDVAQAGLLQAFWNVVRLFFCGSSNSPIMIWRLSISYESWALTWEHFSDSPLFALIR